MEEWSSLVARQAHILKVVGSSPTSSINGLVAQLVEHLVEAQGVGGSSPL